MPDGAIERRKRKGHAATAIVPNSTYRLQLSKDFTFDDAASQVPYIAELGVSHLYLSPILSAAPGSTHFYDVVDHSTIDPVLGGREGLMRLKAAAAAHGLGLIADIVPNHMAVPTPVYANKALWSVLQHGKESEYATWFDVDWSSTNSVLMPVLGQRIGAVLAAEQLTIDTMVVPGFESEGEVPVLRYYEHVFPIKAGTENLPLAALVTEQHYRLAYWRVANEELNYRRFFDVGSLVAVRIEDPQVFDATHKLIIDLVLDGTLDGLRVDHPDGLADPTGYVNALSEATSGAWIVVEKILENEETMPSSWKVAGTTGYDASWRIGALLRDPAGSSGLAATLRRITGDAMGDLEHIVNESKHLITTRSLPAEVRRLATRADDICRSDVRLRDHTWTALHECIDALLIAFDRYRAYVIHGVQASPTSVEAIDAAARRARLHLDPERYETLDVVVDLLKGEEVGSAGKTLETARTEFVTRFQQACGAVMAKGVEDTAYYRWTHLLPLCEVGSPAERFSLAPAAFHAAALERQYSAPHTMNALTTHDIKRSEDVRARLGTLSEVAHLWDEWLTQVRSSVAPMRPTELDGRTENLWWQTLAGSVYEDGSPLEWDRLETYLIKAMREAKEHTTWVDVNQAYENAVLWFAQACHADTAVREALVNWTHETELGVRAAVLSQKLIQLTMPGIPDIYQGTEVVRPLLVDPDNRRAVDFAPLGAMLRDLDSGHRTRSLSEEKLLVTSRALAVRQRNSTAFIGDDAGYQALAASSGHAVVFSRLTGAEARAVIVATRAALELERLGGWSDHTVSVPEGRWVDALTGSTYSGGLIRLSELLAEHPVALLELA